MPRLPIRFLIAGLMAVSLPAQAQDLATDGLEHTIARLSENQTQDGFELGMLQTLRAVEKTLQGRYDYGLGQRIVDLPVLRIGTPNLVNPAPKDSQADTLSSIVATFVADIATARATLGRAETDGINDFDLTLQDIWFDVNGNAAHDNGESAIDLLGPVILGRGAFSEFSGSDIADTTLTVRFDRADHAWLTAYTNMLSGFGNLYLAFDPEPVLRKLADARAALADAPEIPNVYDPDELARQIAELESEQVVIDAQKTAVETRLRPLRDKQRELWQEHGNSEDTARKADIQRELEALQNEMKPLQDQQRDIRRALNLIRNEIAAAKAKLPSAPGPIQSIAQNQRETIDLIYTIITALEQQPDPAHIRAAHDDWRAMIEHNRKFWALLDEETDNDREWIPNARQTSALPIEIPPRTADAWQNILSDAQAVLDGTLLIPHPLLPQGYGISLPAYVDDPAPLKLTDWIHGVGAYPFAAKGPRITGQSWQAFQRLTRGNAGGFALFFN